MKHLLSELAGKVLMIEESALRSIAGKLSKVSAVVDSGAMIATAANRDKVKTLEVDADGTAIIPIRGMILKAVPPILEWWGEFLGWEFTGTEATRELIVSAAEDSRVDRILLDIDSPGGTIDGLQALADDIYTARGFKPVTAHVDGMMASAALWLGVQASRVEAGPTSEIGSIGVFTVLEDWSAAAEDAGIKVIVISSAPGKGHALGAPIPEEQIANMQHLIDGLTDQFEHAVARGRGMEIDKAKALATGAMWLGNEAKRLGLVDAVGPDSKALATSSPTPKGSEEQSTMTKEEKQRLEDAEKRAIDAEARATGLQAAVEAGQAQQREALMDKHSDRVPPSARDAIAKAGESFGSDVTAFESYLETLPIFTHAEPIGIGGDNPEANTSPNGPKISLSIRQLAGAFGKPSAVVQRDLEDGTGIDEVVGVLANGDIAIKDEDERCGYRAITQEDWKKRRAN
jgi:signal peptide peptidase SppA